VFDIPCGNDCLALITGIDNDCLALITGIDNDCLALITGIENIYYSETCLHRTSLGPTFGFVIDRCSVYTG